MKAKNAIIIIGNTPVGTAQIGRRLEILPEGIEGKTKASSSFSYSFTLTGKEAKELRKVLNFKSEKERARERIFLELGRDWFYNCAHRKKLSVVRHFINKYRDYDNEEV